jgi:hypothetical protein
VFLSTSVSVCGVVDSVALVKSNQSFFFFFSIQHIINFFGNHTLTGKGDFIFVEFANLISADCDLY